MTYTLRFLPEVEEDIISGYVWYETKARGLGEEFLRIFYASASEISWNPLLYSQRCKAEREKCQVNLLSCAGYARSAAVKSRG